MPKRIGSSRAIADSRDFLRAMVGLLACMGGHPGLSLITIAVVMEARKLLAEEQQRASQACPPEFNLKEVVLAEQARFPAFFESTFAAFPDEF